MTSSPDDPPQPSRREAAVAGHNNDPATAHRALDAADGPTRATALGALRRLGVLDAATLSTALDDSDWRVRRRAAELAAEQPDVDLVPALADHEGLVVEMAAFACGERERADRPVVDALLDLARTADDPLVREAAVAALGAIGDRRGLQTIIAGCTDKPAIRRRAVLALAPFLDDPDAQAALRAALDDRDWQVRQAAEDLERASADAP
ncbi:MAG: HEAT repeat domain-containing protein [Actinomycetota bacterium]